MELILSTESFFLKFNPKVFESDIAFPVNTSLEISVQSDGFAATAAMDTSVKDLALFSVDFL